MLIWPVSALLNTFAFCAYLSRKGFERIKQHKAIRATLLATVCGATGIYIVQYLASSPIVTPSPTPDFSSVTAEPEYYITQNMNEKAKRQAEKSAIEQPVLKWVKLKKKNYELKNYNFVSLIGSPHLVRFSGQLLNKYNKTVIGLEFEVTVRNCGRAGGNRTRCIIESGPHLLQATEVIIHPQQWSSVGATAPILSVPEHHVLNLDLKRVAYFEGEWPKEKKQDVSMFKQPNYEVSTSMIDYIVTCGDGERLNTKPAPSGGILKAGLLEKGIEHRC